jgi:hypothetical protein
VQTGGHYSKKKRIVAGYHSQHVIGQYFSIKESEDPVLGGLWSDYVSLATLKRSSEFWALPAKTPPIGAYALAPV